MRCRRIMDFLTSTRVRPIRVASLTGLDFVRGGLVEREQDPAHRARGIPTNSGLELSYLVRVVLSASLKVR